MSDQISQEDFKALLEAGKSISQRMIDAAGENGLPEMAMAISIVMAELAHQAGETPDEQIETIDNLCFTAKSVLEWVKATPPEGEMP